MVRIASSNCQWYAGHRGRIVVVLVHPKVSSFFMECLPASVVGIAVRWLQAVSNQLIGEPFIGNHCATAFWNSQSNSGRKRKRHCVRLPAIAAATIGVLL
jgi:hypothetical protein